MRHALRLALTLLACGCNTPPGYESAPLPRFLVDDVPVAAAELKVVEPPVVPVAERPIVTLPDAVRECVLNNMRLKTSEERVRVAQADYITESLIPNAQLMVDAQLLPITSVSFENQGGPPQYDALVTMPVDWFLFGKRVAAQAAAKHTIEAAQAEFSDQIRRQISQTVDSFYDALEADIAQKLVELDLNALRNLEKLAIERGKAGDKTALEQRRVRLAILDVQREGRKRRAAAEITKSKQQANIGRPPDTPDFVVQGTLAVRATAPQLTVTQAWALAEKHRPDLEASRRGIVAADAAVVREQKRAYPSVSVIAGADYQDQLRITGFRNPWLYTVAVNTTLPATDRNQGRIQAAQAIARAARAGLEANIRDARAEVEQAIAEYTEAINGVTGEDIASLRQAREVRDDTIAAYRKGDRDLLDALDAERAYRDRLRNTLANLADYWQALNHVNAAVGCRVLSAQEADRDTFLEAARP